MHSHSKGQPCPGLPQNKHGQKVKEGDSPLLLHLSETSPGVLCTALESSAQERPEPIEASLEEGQENNQWAGAPLL